MANVTGKYESVLIVSLKNGEEAVATTVEKFKTLIEQNATLESVDEWGKRRLAYPINDETDGYYVPSFIAELDRIYKITDGVLRSIIVRKEA